MRFREKGRKRRKGGKGPGGRERRREKGAKDFGSWTLPMISRTCQTQ